MEYTEGIQSPELFRKWAAISAVAGALERKVWIRSQRHDVFPNLYVLLVGPPGSGKTFALNACEQLWKTLPEHKVAETSLTKAALVDRLAESVRIIRHPIQMEFNALLVASKELGALIPQYDPDFLNALTYFWDSIRYDEKRRYGKNNGEALVIERPCLNLIGCTTPSYLTGTMPPFAWDQGFFARVIIIYSDITDITPLNLLDEDNTNNAALQNALAHDIKLIGERVGRMKFTAPAIQAIETWNAEGQKKDKPSHPRLMNYCTRRTLQLLKLCIIAAADRGADNIDIPDYDAALAWLAEAEKKHARGVCGDAIRWRRTRHQRVLALRPDLQCTAQQRLPDPPHIRLLTRPGAEHRYPENLRDDDPVGNAPDRERQGYSVSLCQTAIAVLSLPSARCHQACPSTPSAP